MLFVALLVGQALTLLRGAGGSLVPAALALAVAVPLEHLSPLPLTERIPVWGEVPTAYRWLARDDARALAEGAGARRGPHPQGDARGVLLHLPLQADHPRLRFLSAAAQRAAPARGPRSSRRESSVQVLQRVGVDTVLVHHGRGKTRGLEDAVAEAVAAGRLASLARFTGPDAHVYQGTMDEVVRLVPVPPEPGAPMPGGMPARDPAWRYSATAGDARAAGDGDLSTAWTVPGELRGDEVLEIVFDRSRKLAGVVLPLRRDSAFPTVLRIEGLAADGEWGRLARLDGPHVLQLVDQLLVIPARPRSAST
jgi:hypothetical protein